MPQYRFQTFVFSFWPPLDFVSLSWCHPIPQTRFRKVGMEQGWLCLHPALSLLPQSQASGSCWLLSLIRAAADAPLCCTSVQLPGPCWAELQSCSHPVQPSPQLGFLLEKGQYDQTKSVSALSSFTFQPKCSCAPLLVIFLKPCDYGQELKVSFSSFFQ